MGEPTCRDCGVPLEGGFVRDRTYGTNAQSSWVEGAPEKSAWTGVKLWKRRQIPMYAWRCPRCSEVRFYAPEM